MRRSPFRGVMLTVLITVAIVVFALVTELSRVSQQGLDDAIVRDAGLRGSYEITLDPSLELSPGDAYAAMEQVAADLHMSMWGYWEDLPEVQSECPPFQQVGEQVLRVLWRSPGVPFDLPFGQTAGIDTQWCIDGQAIPSNALYLADSDAKAIYGGQLYIRSDYRNLVLLSTLGLATRGYILVSGRDADLSGQVRATVLERIASIVAESGIDPAPGVIVRRVDQADQSVRAAANGVAVTYGVIGWGVLLLAGLGLMVVQVTNARQRSWFYGLARALGADGRRIGALLAVDAGMVLIAGTALAIVVLLMFAVPVHDFARSAFGVESHVVSASLLRNLLLGLSALLVTSTAVPLIQTLRRDPLGVLEAPRD